MCRLRIESSHTNPLRRSCAIRIGDCIGRGWITPGSVRIPASGERNTRSRASQAVIGGGDGRALNVADPDLQGVPVDSAEEQLVKTSLVVAEEEVVGAPCLLQQEEESYQK